MACSPPSTTTTGPLNLDARQSRQSGPKLTCIQVNLNHSRNALHELNIFTASHEPDIIFVNEPYTGNNGILGKIPGYYIHQFPNTNNNNNHNPSQSPVKAAILIKNKVFCTMGYTEYSDSNLAITKICNHSNKQIYLISIYIEPRTADHHQSLKKLELFIKNTTGALHLICGDFNGWHTAWGSKSNNKTGNEIFELITLNNLIINNTGNHPTFETITHGQPRDSIVDLTLTSNNTNININNWRVNTHICPSSDHHAIQFDFIIDKNISTTKNKKLSTFRYNTNNIKWDQIGDTLTSEINTYLTINPDMSQHSIQDIDNSIAIITAAIQNACDRCLPKSTHTTTRPPWWSEQLEELKQKVIKNHHTLSRLAKRKLPLTETIAEREKLKKEYADAICTAATTNFRDFCNKQQKEDVWSITNRIIQTKPITNPPATLKKDDGTFTTCPSDTATALINKFFPDDTPNADPHHLNLHREMQSPVNNTTEPPFTTTEIMSCLKTMNPKKAPGPDHLTADICLHFTKNFPTIITNLYNRCLELEYFPRYWKEACAKIIPKPNKNKYTETSSFRPIGLINVFGKLLEKLIINRLTHHIAVTNQQCSKQFGFKQQTSTNNAIHSALETINQAKANNEQVLAISLDIMAAFDNAWWPAIFKRLRDIKCPTNLYQILISYTQGRKVYINFLDCSVSKTLSRGCIQGSVCGPTLWNLILDDLLLTKLPDGCHLQAYADDILLIAHSKNIENLERITNSSLETITTWGKSVKLKFGPDKTQAISFTHKSRKCKITMHNQPIVMQSQIKYLGLIIDQDQKFIKHSEYIIEKSKKLFNKITNYIRPTWGVSPENIRIIYHQVIQPIISYAAGIWAHATRYNHVCNKLLSVQRLFAIKIIQGFRTIRTATAISLAQLTPLPDKIREIADTEQSKMTGYTKFLPHDVTIERPAPLSTQLHPADRTGIEYTEINDIQQYDNFCIEIYDHIQIFTDGSKHDETVGAAFVAINTNGTTLQTKKLKLHDCCSVFQAEMLALKHATDWIITHNDTNKFCLLSDSKSGLTELTNPNTSNHLANRILHNHHRIKQQGKFIQYAWVRAHIGIGGNELADNAAKAAARLHKSPDYLSIPISYIKHRNYTVAQESTHTYYTLASPHTLALIPSYSLLNKYIQKINSKPNYAITQLLTNHGLHKEYLHRFKITDNDHCPCDNLTTQTLKHLIEQCPRFAATRLDHLITAHTLTDQYDLLEIINSELTIDTYHTHITYIIKNLKNFNKT